MVRLNDIKAGNVLYCVGYDYHRKPVIRKIEVDSVKPCDPPFECNEYSGVNTRYIPRPGDDEEDYLFRDYSEAVKKKIFLENKQKASVGTTKEDFIKFLLRCVYTDRGPTIYDYCKDAFKKFFNEEV